MFISSALYSLEDDWTDIVEGHANLSEQLKYSITYILQLCAFLIDHFTFTLNLICFTFTYHWDFLLSLSSHIVEGHAKLSEQLK